MLFDVVAAVDGGVVATLGRGAITLRVGASTVCGRLLPGYDDHSEFLDGSCVLDFVGGQFWYSTPEYLEEVCCHCNGEVMLQGKWILAVGWVQVPGVREAGLVHCKNVELKVLVVVRGGSDVETIGCMWRPGSS